MFWRSVLLSFAFLLFGCKWLGSDDEPEDAGEAKVDEPAKPAPSAGAPKACGSPDRPCTWAEVPEKTVARIQAVADLAIATLYAGKSPKQVADTLRAEADVSVLSATNEMIRYHVKGGRPAWVWLVSSKQMPTIGSPLPMPVTLTMAPPEAAEKEPPAGSQTKGETPKKKALILSAFQWQWQLWERYERSKPGSKVKPGDLEDETKKLAELFSTVPDYETGVTLKENVLVGDTIEFGMGVDDFKSWRNYDVIHVSTHGTSCAKGATDCEPAIATGDLLKFPGDKAARSELIKHYNRSGVDVGFVPFSDDQRQLAMAKRLTPKLVFDDASRGGGGEAMDGSTRYTAGPFMLVTKTWFEKTYEEKPLDDKIIFLNACSSGAKEEALPKALAGRATVVVGWDRPMKMDTSTVAAEHFWALALGYPHALVPRGRAGDDDDAAEQEGGDERPLPGGLSIDDVFTKMERNYPASTLTRGPMKSLVIEGVMAEDASTGARLSPDGDGRTRAREIVSLVQGRRKLPLQDGSLVEMEGVPGDGKADKLKLEAEVIGIADDDDPSDYVIGVDVDGRTAEQTWTPTEKVEPGRWRGKATVELGFDLESGKTFALEPWVDLPGGGRSRWRYENIGVQYFSFTVDGPKIPEQTFAIDPARVRFTGIGSATDGGFVIVVSDKRDTATQSANGTMLWRMDAGAQGPGIASGKIPFGTETDGGAWSLHFYWDASSCTGSFDGCDYINLRVRSGEFEVGDFAFGKGRVRPTATGPTYMTGTFEARAESTGPEWGGETYTIEGAFSLAE